MLAKLTVDIGEQFQELFEGKEEEQP